MSVYPAKLLTECILFVFSWLIQKFVIFRKEKNADDRNSADEKNETCSSRHSKIYNLTSEKDKASSFGHSKAHALTGGKEKA